MLKQRQQLKISQRISPQQIQFIKLVQVPTAMLEQRIKEELETNPALEDEQMGFGEQENDPYKSLDEKEGESYEGGEENASASEMSIDDYLAADEYDFRTRLPQGGEDEDDDYEAPIVQGKSLYDQLHEQMGLLRLSDTERIIGENIIGNIDDDGYFRGRGSQDPVRAIVNHLAFHMSISTTLAEVESVLKKIQRFDPAGVGARDLRECLLLQLHRKEQTPAVQLAIVVMEKYFDEITKKHFDKIRSRLGVPDEDLKQAYQVITHLNPKPGESQSIVKDEYIIPDFIVTIENGEPQIRLNNRNAPDLKVSRSYLNMYKDYKKLEKKGKSANVQATLEFVKQRIDAAKWFIDAIKQRQFTLLKTMESIVEKQKAFFLANGDERKLRPMILKDIADEIGMDISTVSRVANSKYVQTDFGNYPLKFFFTEGIESEDGMVSNREVKKAMEEMILAENKRKPLSDDKIAEMLNKRGYDIARRTVAKYREQMSIPVARLRKEF
jgi:RNA polymerase sigma-54 factor